MAQQTADDTEQEHHGPSRGAYLQIAGILAVMTTVEVLLYVFRESLGRAVTTPSLIILTLGKFVLVGAWFMHLRFDHPALRRMFVGGLALAAVIFAVVAADWFLGSNGLDPQGF
ncbi:cytochrome C oxidase subunit IV family protein [Euzebya tangerina]|uniref:cytochrome C oxidase subunit IV family protein n=1 Tax=Euzebya tangerina TaxID=591198 RepID=UPI000E310B17|nr:cytochrome C oxidase subunit IV family protein [Euzebya tangerina]